MKSHFKTFGQIEKFSFKKRSRYTSGTILYKSTSSATACLNTQLHNVAGHQMILQPGDSWTQPVNKSGSPHVTQSTTNILMMKDEVLALIFEQLTCMDFVSLHDTCQKFREIAGQLFVQKHKTVDVTDEKTLTLHKIRSLLMNYGKNIRCLRIDSMLFSAPSVKLLDLIIRNCPSLCSLTLIRFQLQQGIFDGANHFFPHIDVLHLDYCDLSDNIFNTLKFCRNLQSIRVLQYSNQQMLAKAKIAEMYARNPQLTEVNVGNRIFKSADDFNKNY